MKTNAPTWHTEHSTETTASPERIWALFRDVPGWKTWNAGIEEISLEGPFASGTWMTMRPPGQDPLRTQLIEVREGACFVDETRLGDLVVTVTHRIEQVATGRTRIVYAVDAAGPDADQVGPAVAGDFPQVLAALVQRATATESK